MPFLHLYGGKAGKLEELKKLEKLFKGQKSKENFVAELKRAIRLNLRCSSWNYSKEDRGGKLLEKKRIKKFLIPTGWWKLQWTIKIPF